MQSQDLIDTLAICSSLSRYEEIEEPVSTAIKTLIQAHETSSQAQQEFQITPVNSGAILSSFLHCLSSIGLAASLLEDDLVRIVEVYHWHRTVLSEISSIVALRDPIAEQYASRVHAACVRGLLSEDASMRTSILVLLKHRTSTSEIVSQALEVEGVPLTPQDAREKTMHLRRLGIALKNIDESNSEDIEVGLLYTFAMLKVNFKPLWSEAIDVISNLSKARPSAQTLIWRLLLEQLNELAQADMRDSVPSAGPIWATLPEDYSTQSSMAQWRQNDLVCTAFTSNLNKYGDSLVRFLELSRAKLRTYTAKEIQVRYFAGALEC